MLLLLLAKIKSLGEFVESLPYASAAAEKLKNSLKWAMGVAPSLTSAAIMLMMAGFLVFQIPGMHKHWIRSHIGSKVVEIVMVSDSGRIMGGGTGSYVQAPSGQVYILTNAHVCDAFRGAPMVTVVLPDGSQMPRRIIAISGDTDLCLVEAPPGVSGIKLAHSEAKVGEGIYVVGHPRLMPLHVSPGDVLGMSTVDIDLGVIGMDMQEKDCHHPKNKIVDEEGFFGMSVPVCMEEIDAIQTTAVGLPGNSGSPVVDSYGHLVGVLFAGDNEVHWSLLVSLDDIQAFVANY